MICLGCLQEKKLKGHYCTKFTLTLFDGKTPKPLNFDKTQFYRTRSELAERMSISGVQDKLSLAFNDTNELVPVSKNGHYILKGTNIPVFFSDDITILNDSTRATLLNRIKSII